jgi:hypothetical protein
MLAEGRANLTILTRVDGAGAVLRSDSTAYRCGNRLWPRPGGSCLLVSEHCSRFYDQRMILLDSALANLGEVYVEQGSPFGNPGTTIYSALTRGDSS